VEKLDMEIKAKKKNLSVWGKKKTFLKSR